MKRGIGKNASAFKRLSNAFEFFPIPPFHQEGHTSCLHSLISHKDFRGTVLHGATESGEDFAFLHVRSRAEVDEFDVELVINDDIFVLPTRTVLMMLVNSLPMDNKYT